jgi:hypothetical protein
MAQRNRASGWKHAKLSGHSNETRVKELLDNDQKYRTEFMKRICHASESINSISIGGLHETDVPGVLGKKTKSKTDLKINLTNGSRINISIKKSSGGQVYFVRAGLFIEVFEKQFNKSIPLDVQRAIKLFWAAADDAPSIIEQYGDKTEPKFYNLQVRHKSLNATTLKAYDMNLYSSMLQWFKDNIYELAKLSFAMGAAKNPDEWSDYVWYINLLGENDLDEAFFIEDVCHAAIKVANSETYYGTSNGGTTILLPFGFVQWHQSKMQFHHSYEKVCHLLDIL